MYRTCHCHSEAYIFFANEYWECPLCKAEKRIKELEEKITKLKEEK